MAATSTSTERAQIQRGQSPWQHWSTIKTLPENLNQNLAGKSKSYKTRYKIRPQEIAAKKIKF